jgi:uncharacterized protein (TIGR02284 family)
MQAKKEEIDCLNSLLRGELAATVTYQQALARVGAEAGATELRRIHDEHRAAANTLRQHIHEVGGQPDQHPGAWGAWARLVEGTAKIFGDTAALKALKEGEEKGAHDYEKALDDKALPEQSRTLIHTDLLPRTQEHVVLLDGLMGAQKA